LAGGAVVEVSAEEVGAGGALRAGVSPATSFGLSGSGGKIFNVIM
jgi:hypothetical protein